MKLKPFRIERPEGRVVVRLEVIEEPTGLICVVDKIRGRIALGRHGWVAVVREEIANIEGLARAAGCIEMRLGGRDWSRVLPNYEPLVGVKNGLRKALIDG